MCWIWLYSPIWKSLRPLGDDSYRTDIATGRALFWSRLSDTAETHCSMATAGGKKWGSYNGPLPSWDDRSQWCLMLVWEVLPNGGPGSTQLPSCGGIFGFRFDMNLVLLFQANSCIRMMMFNQHIQENQDEGYLSPFRIGNWYFNDQICPYISMILKPKFALICLCIYLWASLHNKIAELYWPQRLAHEAWLKVATSNER